MTDVELTERTVAHQSFDYTRMRRGMVMKDGQPMETDLPYQHTALRGEVIKVNASDLERGERFGALVDGPLLVIDAPVVTPPTTPDVAGGSDPVELHEPVGGHLEPVDPSAHPAVPARPRNVAPVGTWRDYAVARHDAGFDDGLTREQAGELSKDELVAKYPA